MLSAFRNCHAVVFRRIPHQGRILCAMNTTPSLRQLWKMYKALLARDEDIDRRDQVLAQNSFCTGARAILKVQSRPI